MKRYKQHANLKFLKCEEKTLKKKKKSKRGFERVPHAIYCTIAPDN